MGNFTTIPLRYRQKMNLRKSPMLHWIELSRVDQFHPIVIGLRVVISVYHLVSWRYHIISSIHRLALVPQRTKRAVFSHPAIQKAHRIVEWIQRKVWSILDLGKGCHLSTSWNSFQLKLFLWIHRLSHLKHILESFAQPRSLPYQVDIFR